MNPNMKLNRIDPKDISKLIDPVVAMQRETPFLCTAKADNEIGTLTCAWGAFGNVWRKKTMTIYIRPIRHTLPIIDKAGRFTMTFFEGHQKELMYLGTVSANDVPDKIEKSGLHILELNDNDVTFEEGKYVIVCKVLYKQQIQRDNFLYKSVADAVYNAPNQFSYMFVGEIEDIYEIER